MSFNKSSSKSITKSTKSTKLTKQIKQIKQTKQIKQNKSNKLKNNSASLEDVTQFFHNFGIDTSIDKDNSKLYKNPHINNLQTHTFYGSLKDKLNIHLITNYLDEKLSYELFDALKNIRYNSDEESMIRIHGKRVKIPRQQTAYGVPGTTYHFSGISVMARDWTIDDDSIDSYVGNELNNIARKTGKSACSVFNYALVNNYMNQSDYIGYHSDDEKELGKYPVIAGISLGQEREMYFKSNITGEVKKIALPHNSLIIMHYPTNGYWKHSIPKTARHLGQRISLTFRSVDETLLNIKK